MPGTANEHLEQFEGSLRLEGQEGHQGLDCVTLKVNLVPDLGARSQIKFLVRSLEHCASSDD